MQADAPKGVPLDEVKDLTVTTAGGKEVEVKDAMKQLAKGGVVISADGKKVDPAYLKALKDDVLVLASSELVAPEGNSSEAGVVLPNIKFQVVPGAPAPAPGK